MRKIPDDCYASGPSSACPVQQEQCLCWQRAKARELQAHRRVLLVIVSFCVSIITAYAYYKVKG